MTEAMNRVQILLAEGHGDRHIARTLGITRHAARGLIVKARIGAVPPSSLGEIEPRTVSEFADRITACWHRSREAYIEAGRLLCLAKASLDHGEFETMVATLPFKIRKAEMLMKIYHDRRLVNPQYVALLPNELGTLYDITCLKEDRFESAIVSGVIHSDMERRDVPRPGPSRSMNRVEVADSLDPFFTPPWATRALCEHVLHRCGEIVVADHSVWEPACGEGHMSKVLKEYFGKVQASDVFGYAPGDVIYDFLDYGDPPFTCDWIVTNPPFRRDTAERFVLRALDLARTGVAIFVALQFIETVGRYERIFKDRPPTLISFFSERVNCCKGRWNPDGSTDAAYVWLVWKKDREPMPPFWIPPGQRIALTKADDRARFAAWSMQEAAE